MFLLHTTIKDAVPEAKVTMSYGLPGGLCVIDFTKNHLLFYDMSNTVFK